MSTTNNLLSPASKKEATQQLESIVAEFNGRFEQWMQEYDCRANFGWKYGADRTSPKAMTIQSIDQIVFRPAPPPFEVMRDTVAPNT